MVREQIEARGIRDARVLDAMRRVPRHLFVPKEQRRAAYHDCPLPIAHGQTISQPYIVALMSSLLALHGHEQVMEVGTGSGYQAAVLSLLAGRVISLERLPELADTAQRRLYEMGYANVEVHVGDGSLGWQAEAPYDGILVAAGALEVPEPLVAQLAPLGRLVIPVGDGAVQTLLEVTRASDGSTSTRRHGSVVFVPLVGQHGWPPFPLQ